MPFGNSRVSSQTFSEAVASAATCLRTALFSYKYSSVPSFPTFFGSILLSLNQRAHTYSMFTQTEGHRHMSGLSSLPWKSGSSGPRTQYEGHWTRASAHLGFCKVTWEANWISLRGKKNITALLMNALAKRINMLTSRAASYGFIKRSTGYCSVFAV